MSVQSQAAGCGAGDACAEQPSEPGRVLIHRAFVTCGEDIVRFQREVNVMLGVENPVCSSIFHTTSFQILKMHILRSLALTSTVPMGVHTIYPGNGYVLQYSPEFGLSLFLLQPGEPGSFAEDTRTPSVSPRALGAASRALGGEARDCARLTDEAAGRVSRKRPAGCALVR